MSLAPDTIREGRRLAMGHPLTEQIVLLAIIDVAEQVTQVPVDDNRLSAILGRAVARQAETIAAQADQIVSLSKTP